MRGEDHSFAQKDGGDFINPVHSSPSQQRIPKRCNVLQEGEPPAPEDAAPPKPVREKGKGGKGKGVKGKSKARLGLAERIMGPSS